MGKGFHRPMREDEKRIRSEGVLRFRQQLRETGMSLWSIDRRDKLVELYPGGMTCERLMEELNKLPGPRFTHPHQITTMAYHMKIKRQVKVPQPKPSFSPARLAKLAELYPRSDLTIHDILRLLNEVPSPRPVGNIDSLRKEASRRGLHRPDIVPSLNQRPRVTKQAHQRAQKLPEPQRPKLPPPQKAPKRPAMPPGHINQKPGLFLPAEVPEGPPADAGVWNPDVADQAREAKLEKARRLLAQRKDPDVVRAATGLQLHEVYRLRAEVRRVAA